jgi:hypothetical protein
MTIFGRVVRWLRGRPIWAGNRYDPGDNIIISTAMIATFVAYTRSTGSCVAMEMSTSICFIVLTSEKSIGISSICVVIEKTISIRSLVCCSLLLITGFVRITVDGEESADVRCMVAIMVISLC